MEVPFLKEAIKYYEEVVDDPLFDKYVEGIDIDFEKRVDDATQSLTLQLAEKDKIIEKLEKQSSEPNEKMIEKIFGMVLGMMAAKDAERDEKMAERFEKMLKIATGNKI
jgi:ribosome-binding protein aMBF1 (putative translation factor)